MDKLKRCYIDIETSLLEARIWRPGKQYVGPECITKEAQIICICYKWAHEKKVHALDWTDDYMLKKFVAVMNEADEIVAHNGKAFDMKWVAWELLKARIPAFPNYKVIDTLTMMRAKYRAPSNKLDYLCNALFNDPKVETGGRALWENVMDGDKAALKKMIAYCKHDVIMLEELHDLIQPYFLPRTNVAILEGKDPWCCAHCASDRVRLSKTRITPLGTKRRQMQCNECGRYYTVSNTVYENMCDDRKEKSSE